MSEHYYSQKPTSTSNPSHFNATIRTFTFTFQTDDGVFSKKQIDFGTKTLLEHFEQPEVLGDLLDLGCGYGPIGITLAKEFDERNIFMVDINERAVELAKENASINEVGNVEVLESDGVDTVKNQTFAAVLTNPPFRAGKAIVHQMIEDSFPLLKTNGELWVVVQKKQGAPSLKAKMEEIYENAEVVARSKGYFVLRSIKID
ncbi:16S rRNA methyltransferase [Halalkalibacillus sediminis]|uniref:16S rRNA methyltransferase n=1 Tax=Halalkalibacillus sediminis TaxID=2018042 RepID=A0A2I0QQK6_9BACI|nr:class I SAM-dependent methyltransferase [Halalkalibacillus sediminis]PKR76606.1 16S rRNA methyltransferase [Halalkalibacillus sediminis]